MSEQEKKQDKLDMELAKLFEKLEDIKEQMDTMNETLEDHKKELDEQLKKIEAFQRHTLEPNQQIMYKILKKLEGKPEEEE